MTKERLLYEYWLAKISFYKQQFYEEVWAGWVVGEVDRELAEWQNSEGCHQRRWV